MRRPRSAGPLRPAELAEAAILADLTVALLFLGWLMPLGGVLEVLSTIPMAVLGARHRARTVVQATVAAGSVAFLLGGVALWSLAILLSLIGLVVGVTARRGWSRLRLVAAASVVWAMLAGVSVGQLLLFANFRKLTLDQIRIGWRGVRNVMNHFAALQPLLHVGDVVVNDIVRHWWVVIPVGELLLVQLVTAVSQALAGPVIVRLEEALGHPAAPRPTPPPDAAPPAPVPVELTEVAVRYPGADDYALAGANLEIRPGAFVAVVGSNGSGKSTLARVLAGMIDFEGEVARPGSVGLGRPAGTAVVFQRPESQVLGVRARDDVVWGFRAGHGVDVDRLLALVGLEGKGDEETVTLSGGQLQRLAIASALAHRPALLISDESTSMLDRSGRRQLAALLDRLAHEQGVTVVHVTHRPEETTTADLVVSVESGRVTARPGTSGKAPAG